MISKFFIEHPIFASVISIVIVIAGAVSVGVLPIAQYPEITPPTVAVSTTYPGANARVVAETVAAPIEQEVNGVENMIYMSSTSASDGSYNLTVSFDVGTDLDMAQVLVQNRVKLAEAKLPEEVKRQGVNTKKKSTNIVLIISLFSPDGRFDELYLSNYATLRLRDVLSRIDGVGDVSVFPQSDYSMRIWLDPPKLKSRDLTTEDVLAAIREQNVQVAAGQIGQPPAPPGQSFQYTVNVLGRLTDIEQFEEIIIKTGEGGRITRLKDIARIDLGGKSYDLTSGLTGQPSASVLIYQLPGANALNVARQIYTTMEDLQTYFPEGLQYKIPYDTTIFVEQSIQEVFVTLLQAAGLVFLVLFIFLQDWRATVVPAVTIPVSLIGTLAVMLAMGFSLNMLTLFGLVLAIGIVVDDAIVVVEATATYIEQGLKAKEAAIKAMNEVSGPVVATTLVLLAVFVPSAFLPGITGQMYRQFALTIAISTIFSSINALTLSPALAALLLRPPKKRKNIFFRGFDAVFRKTENVYAGMVKTFVRRTAIMLLLFLGLLSLTGWQFTRLPTGFLPIEDQGYVMASIQLPDAASLERSQAVLDAHRRHSQRNARYPGVGFPGRLLADRRHQLLQHGHGFYHHETLGGTHRPGSQHGGDFSQPAASVFPDPGGHCVCICSPGHSRPRCRRRLPDAARRPRRCRAGGTAANGAGARPGRQRPVGPDQFEQHLSGRCTPAFRRGRPHQGQDHAGSAQQRLQHPADLPWVLSTSTTSTSSAVPGRSRSRPTINSAWNPTTSAASICGMPGAIWFPSAPW